MSERDGTTVTVSSKGQISLPVRLRQAAGIRQGDRLALELRPDGTIVLSREQTGEIRRMIGAWRDPENPIDVDQLLDDLRGPVDP